MLCCILQHLIRFILPICVGIIAFGLSLCGLLPDNDKLFPYPAKQKSTTNNPNFRRQSSLYHKKKYNRKRLNVWVIYRHLWHLMDNNKHFTLFLICLFCNSISRNLLNPNYFWWILRISRKWFGEGNKFPH